MELFFDSAWFDARLNSLGLSRSDLGSALGLTEGEILELWKDQREVKARDVRMIAALLGASPAEIAEHAGISTPVPSDDDRATTAILQRLDRIEKTLSELEALVRSIGRPKLPRP
jgi:transcriptional regulator with XRE-family HTH domain